jgi:hypothetical protein
VCGHSTFTAHIGSAFETFGLVKVKRRSIFQAHSDNLKNGAYRAVPRNHRSRNKPLNEKPSRATDLAFSISDGVVVVAYIAVNLLSES